MTFISSAKLHAKRLRRGTILSVLGIAAGIAGIWVLSLNLRMGESSIANNWVNWGLIIISATLLLFGLVGVITGLQGTRRSAGDDSIDVILSDDGLVTRGGYRVPWANIASAEVIRYINNSMVPLLWDYSVLNRVIRIQLMDTNDLDPKMPGVRGKAPWHYLEIDLRRYPMNEYQAKLDTLVEQLTQRRFHTSSKFRHKQF